MLETAPPTNAPGPRPRERGWYRLRRGAPVIAVLGLILAAIWWLDAGTPHPGGAHSTPAADGYVVFALPPNQPNVAPIPAPKVGAQAPDFTLTGLDGTPVRLSDLRGKTVLINFWATWCGPCRKEFPELARLSQEETDRGLVVLAVDVSESRDEVARFAQELGVTFPIVLDSDSTVAHGYRLVALPTSFFLDRDGFVRAQQLGPLTETSLSTKLGQAGFRIQGSR